MGKLVAFLILLVFLASLGLYFYLLNKEEKKTAARTRYNREHAKYRIMKTVTHTGTESFHIERWAISDTFENYSWKKMRLLNNENRFSTFAYAEDYLTKYTFVPPEPTVTVEKEVY